MLTSEQQAREKVNLELARFRSLDPEPKSCNPCEWGKVNARLFPSLAFVAKQVLGIPGSATECERVFSAAGNLTSLLRNRMSPEHIHQVVFILKSFPFDAELSKLYELEETMKRFKAMALADDITVLESEIQTEEDEHEKRLQEAAKRGQEDVPFTGLQLMLEEAGCFEDYNKDAEGADPQTPIENGEPSAESELEEFF